MTKWTKKKAAKAAASITRNAKKAFSDRRTNRKLEAQLLPCPFCGGPATMVHWHGGPRSKRLVGCNAYVDPNEALDNACEIEPQVTGNTPSEAIRRWNIRLPPVSKTCVPSTYPNGGIERMSRRGDTGDAVLAVNEVEQVTCPECNNEQANMGKNVACEECGYGPMPTEAP